MYWALCIDPAPTSRCVSNVIGHIGCGYDVTCGTEVTPRDIAGGRNLTTGVEIARCGSAGG